MSQTCAQLIGYLNDVMHIANPDVAKAYQGNGSVSIWSEGGEWPAYKSVYDEYVLPTHSRDMDVPYEFPGSLNSIGAFLDKRFAKTSVVGLTLECGAGKSTKVVAELHNLKLGKRTFILQPSAAGANSLVNFVNKSSSAVELAITASDVSDCRTCIYLSAGAMLDVILSNKLTENDLVVVDEGHCVTLVHTVILDLLSHYTCKVLLMTASTTHTIRGLRGVKLNAVTCMNADMVDMFAAEGDKAAIVGVTENQAYAAPANALIGATLAINVIYDTGLRPEPRYHAGIVVSGERVATRLEILQMVGRVGRLGRGGTAYYNDNARALPGEGLALYDIMLRAIRNAIGLDSRIDKEKARDAWRASGLISAGVPSSGGMPEPVPIVTGTTPIDIDVIEVVDEDWQSARGHTRESSDDSSNNSRKSHSKYKARRRSGEVVLTSYLKTDGALVAAMEPDPTWRPFRQMGEAEVERDTGVTKFLGWVQRACDRGDMVYPAKFPRADPKVVTSVGREEARLVLAGRMLPSFSEMELMSVIILWNEMADATRGAMRTTYLRQFVDYFESYNMSLSTTGGKLG